MKLWPLLFISLSCNLIRVSAVYFMRYHDEPVPYFLLGALTLLLLSLRKRRSSPVTTSTTSATITTIAAASQQAQCNAGYTLYPGPGRRFCFRYVTIARSWDAAQTACQMENANLPVLDNDSLIPFSEVLIQQFPGVGSSWLRAKTDGNLNARYTDGSAIAPNSPLWVAGTPNTPDDCIVLVFFPQGANLADLSCDTTNNYVCQHF